MPRLFCSRDSCARQFVDVSGAIGRSRLQLVTRGRAVIVTVHRDSTCEVIASIRTHLGKF